MEDEIRLLYEELEEVENKIDKLPYPKNIDDWYKFCEKLKGLSNRKAQIKARIKFLLSKKLEWWLVLKN